MRYLLGVDFGGGSTKATLLDENGKILASSSKEYPSMYPHTMYVEQDPEKLYQAFVENMQALLLQEGVAANKIKAISIDGGTHIAVLMDKQDRVIRPAIYWSDGRSYLQTQQLESKKETIASLTHNIPSTSWTLPQLMWIREHEPNNFAKIFRIRFLKDYIRFRLTGDFLTDTIEAMGSLFNDAHTDEWSEYLCSITGIEAAQLPQITSPSTVVGPVGSRACRECGFDSKMLVVVGSTDTVMEILAAGAIKEGDATIKLATAGRICVITNQPIVSPLLVTYKHLIPGLWYPGSATKACAASLRWFRDTFHCNPTDPTAYQQIDQIAENVGAGSDGLFYHPFLQGEITPYLDASLRASFVGISSSHTFAHFGRAVLEGVAYSLREGLESVKKLGMVPKEPLRLIGGGSRSVLWSQIVSDVLGVPMIKVKSDDSSIGSAMHAGVAVGIFSSYEDAVSKVSVMGESIYPNKDLHDLYSERFYTYKKIVEALQPLYQGQH
jgi:xylulokinase